MVYIHKNCPHSLRNWISDFARCPNDPRVGRRPLPTHTHTHILVVCLWIDHGVSAFDRRAYHCLALLHHPDKGPRGWRCLFWSARALVPVPQGWFYFLTPGLSFNQTAKIMVHEYPTVSCDSLILTHDPGMFRYEYFVQDFVLWTHRTCSRRPVGRSTWTNQMVLRIPFCRWKGRSPPLWLFLTLTRRHPSSNVFDIFQQPGLGFVNLMLNRVCT